jgi:hypothetical protein
MIVENEKSALMMGRMMMMMMGMITAVMEADEQLWRVIVRLKGAGEQRWQLT